MLAKSRSNRGRWMTRACAALMLTSIGGLCLAADHRDSPRITSSLRTLGNLDILDVYAFQSPSNKNNAVLIMTVSTDAGVISPAVFNSDGAYEFRIVGPDGKNDMAAYRIAFFPPDALLRQGYAVTRIDGAATTIVARGITNKALNVKGGGKVMAGLFDDPFFFDLLAFNRFKAKALAGDSSAASEFLNRSNSNVPNNFFGGFNCLAIVLEVPSVKLQSAKNNPNTGVWARTVLADGTQFDRMGRPGINTVAVPDQFKDAFNSGTPATDETLRPIASEELRLLFGLPEEVRTAQVGVLLPDVLTFNTRDKSGFLNGRRLDDDVIDAELSLLSNKAVTTDDVVNDSVFRTTFPYLGTPNPKRPVKR